MDRETAIRLTALMLQGRRGGLRVQRVGGGKVPRRRGVGAPMGRGREVGLG